MEWVSLALFLSFNSTVSPCRTRSIGPGTVPSKVQNSYSTPSARRAFFSTVSSSILTVVAARRPTGGGGDSGRAAGLAADGCAGGLTTALGGGGARGLGAGGDEQAETKAGCPDEQPASTGEHYGVAWGVPVRRGLHLVPH